jgi:multiple sugar transport system substrate-binding protein
VTRTELSRRSLLRAATATAGGVLLASGCGAGFRSGGGVPVAYWNFFTGGDGVRMVGLVNAYRAQAPSVRVTDTTLMWGPPYYTKLAMACAGGRGPDLASMHASRLATFSANLLDEWDLGELAARDVTLDQFPRPVLDRVLIGGRLMALPLDTHPLVLYYNTEICRKAGLLAADGTLAPIRGAEQMLDAGRRAARVTGAVGIAVASFDALASWMVFWSLYRQLGADLRLPDGGPAQLDHAAMVTAMRFLYDMCDGTIASKTLDGDAAPAAFAAQQAGFLFIGPWEVTTALRAGIPFSMTQFPAIFGDAPLVRADSHSFVLPKQAAVDPRVRTAAYDLAVSMLRHSLDWSKGGHIPALSAVADSPEYLALKPQSNYRGAAELAQFDPDAYFSGSGSALMARAGQTLQGVMSRTLTPEQGTDDLVNWLNTQLTEGSPV